MKKSIEFIFLLLNLVTSSLYSKKIFASYKNPWPIDSEESTEEKKETIWDFLISSNMSEIKKALKNEIDTNLKNEEGIYPLEFSCLTRNTQLPKLLLKYKANPNIKNKVGFTLLYRAVIKKKYDLVNLLLRYGACPDEGDRNQNSPLHKSVSQNDFKMSQILLTNKANPNLKNKKDQTPLHIAATQKNKELVKLLLSYKAHIDERSDEKELTALHYAVMSNDENTVAHLLKSGASVDTERNLPQEERRPTYTPLHMAFYEEVSPVVIKLLLIYGSSFERLDMAGKNSFSIILDKLKPLDLDTENESLIDESYSDSESEEMNKVTEKNKTKNLKTFKKKKDRIEKLMLYREIVLDWSKVQGSKKRRKNLILKWLNAERSQYIQHTMRRGLEL